MKHEDSDGFIYFRKENMKTKHAKRKAVKKTETKRTRAAKRNAQVTKEHLRRDISSRVDYQIRSIRERNASSSENVAFINKVFARIRQAISE